MNQIKEEHHKKVFKKLTVMALVLIMIAGLFPVRGAQAATKPGKPGDHGKGSGERCEGKA